MSIAEEMAGLLIRGIGLSPEDKQYIYKAFSSVSYSDSVTDFLWSKTGEEPIFSSGNPNSNVIILFHNKNSFIKWFNKIREQIMEEGENQSQVYATTIFKTNAFGECTADDFKICCLNECKIVKPTSIFLIYQDVTELNDLMNFSNELNSMMQSQIKVFDVLLNDNIKEMPEAVIDVIIDEMKKESED